MASDLFDSAIGKPEHKDYSSSQSPWYPQQRHLGNMFDWGEGLYNRGTYQGPYIGAQSPFTSQAQNLTVQRALDPNSLTAQAQGQLGDTISGKYLNPNTNPNFAGAVNDALGMAKSQIAGLYGGPAGQNIGNSGFQEHLTRNLGTIAGNLYSEQFNRERQNQLNALQMAPGMDYVNLQALSGVGAQQDARSQAEADAGRMAFNSPWENLAKYQGAVTGNYGFQGSTQAPWQSQLFGQVFPIENYMGTGQGGFGNIFGSTVGAAGNAFGGMMKASDVRLKENIKRVGTHDSGVGLYSYNYKGSDYPEIGVIAQEVEKVMPEAVGEIGGGYKGVRYDLLAGKWK